MPKSCVLLLKLFNDCGEYPTRPASHDRPYQTAMKVLSIGHPQPFSMTTSTCVEGNAFQARKHREDETDVNGNDSIGWDGRSAGSLFALNIGKYSRTTSAD